MLDIIFVTYNSEKWIKKCFQSLVESNYDLKQVNIIVVDNASNDNSVELLNIMRNNIQHEFNSISIIENTVNEGFGKANNRGVKCSNGEIVCFINIDTEFFVDTLFELDKAIKKSKKDIGLWEFRQFPYEHPKNYDVLSGEVSWASGAAFAMKREMFLKVDGFDEKLFMYTEDVDLSWRVRCLGYKLIYVPKVKIMHYSYETANVIKLNQHVYGVTNNLLLRYRFGNLKKIIVGHLITLNLIVKKEQVKGAKKLLYKEYIKHFGKILWFYSKGKYKNNKYLIPVFRGLDYSINRDGAYFKQAIKTNNPLVSIIVRTCGRPSVLRETLISLRNQTYDNIQIVIVEDGINISENMIKQEFGEMNIDYFATMDKVGRSRVGNIAMTRAEGKYINFLDDDDLFYADHVETIVNILENSTERAAYAIGFEAAAVIESLEPYIYEIKSCKVIHRQEFDKIMLCHHNYIPIQCIMFEKSLYEQYGGLDETVDALEDWDLWVRYSLYTDFIFINKTTSIYKVPYEESINKQRQKALDKALVVMREKHKSYIQNVSVNSLAKLYDDTISK